jgi:hypothetical protein
MPARPRKSSQQTNSMNRRILNLLPLTLNFPKPRSPDQESHCSSYCGVLLFWVYNLIYKEFGGSLNSVKVSQATSGTKHADMTWKSIPHWNTVSNF